MPGAELRDRLDDERGAVLILLSAVLVALLAVAGLVLDFALVRADRQKNKSTADFAVTAGVRALHGPSGWPRPWPGVCEAHRYLVANDPQLTGLTGTWKTRDGTAVSDPCSSPAVSPYTNGCVPGTPSSWAWFEGTADSGRIHVDIKSGYDLSDGAFPEESLVTGDGGDPALGHCDQLAVIIRERETPGFGRVVYDGDLTSRVRSVGRVAVGGQGDATAALLLLERHDCLTLDIDGSSGARAIVRGNGNRPGLIHVDSLGNGANCSSDDKVLDGDFGDAPYGARIQAQQSETGTPAAAGIIGVRALSSTPGAVPTNAHTPSPSTVVAQPDMTPTGRPLVGRGVVDTRYLTPIKALKTEAEPMMNWTAADAAPWADAVIDCNDPPPPLTARKVFVDCPAGRIFTNSFEFAAADAEIVFNGPVTVEGPVGTTLTFKDARKVYIKGSTAAEGVNIKRNLHINTGGRPDCDARLANEPTKSTAFVIGNGPFASTGHASVRMCQTMVFLADGTLPPVSGTAPTPNSFRGKIQVAGQGDLDWSAPNATPDPPNAAQLAKFEDLALWTETEARSTNTAELNRVEGTGRLAMKGIFFLPNANPFRIAGGGGHDIGADAQFIARKLMVAGGGYLSMKPEPNNAVSIPYLEGFALVR